MRIASILFAGSVSLLLLVEPTLAKSPDIHPATETSSPSACNAYEQAADGSWTKLSCQEVGGNGQTQHRPATHHGEEQPR